jgi:ankyrin repeat protein
MPLSVGKRSRRERQRRQVISPSVLFHEPKLCLLIHFVFSQNTPLMLSAACGFLELCRVLVASKADVAARNGCRSPWRARNLPLTLRCSVGDTALKLAIHNNKADVAAYLRSIGAPQ